MSSSLRSHHPSVKFTLNERSALNSLILALVNLNTLSKHFFPLYKHSYIEQNQHQGGDINVSCRLWQIELLPLTELTNMILIAEYNVVEYMHTYFYVDIVEHMTGCTSHFSLSTHSLHITRLLSNKKRRRKRCTLQEVL